MNTGQPYPHLRLSAPPLRRLRDGDAAAVLALWRNRLAIHHSVRTERISRYQVVGPDGAPGAELVGVVRTSVEAVIYHTRALMPEDIVHELLHVARPDWSEAEVVAQTQRLLRECAAA